MSDNYIKDEASQVSRDMREVYEQLKSGLIERKQADALANIAGKNMKALSLLHLDRVRADNLPH